MVLFADNECRIEEIQHNGKPLDMVNGEYRLLSFSGCLTLFFEDGAEDKFVLFDDKPLIFKVRKDWTGDGHKVSGVTKGHFIVIASADWTREGDPPVEAEGCVDNGFMAHYFYRGERDSAGDMDGFKECEIGLTRSGLEFKGECVFDDSEQGDLLVGDAPILEPASDVVWARIGEEKENGWTGESFRPAERSLARVLNSRQGRFFVRVYGKDSKLLDSDEFRYVADLREIRVNGEPYSADMLLVPSPTGHSPTEVQFVGADSALIRPILTADGTHATVQPEGAVIVAPCPDGDHISCALESDTGRVEIVLNLPRVWWRMERDGSETGLWRDTPLVMMRQEFRTHAAGGTAICLRLPASIPSVSVGFNEECDRVYRPQRKGGDTNISLADFVDYSQIDQRLNEDASFNVRCSEAILTLIRISTDPIPTITSFSCEPAAVATGEQATLRWKTQDAEAGGIAIVPEIGVVEPNGSIEVEPSKTTTYTLRLKASGLDDVTQAVTVIVRRTPQAGEKLFPCVKRAGVGTRRGKGFSRGEIDAAGLTDADAARRAIPIDRRRRSTHKVNIDMLRRLGNA